MVDESRRLKERIATHEAANKGKHYSEVDYVRQQRDTEIAFLKEQHKAGQAKIQKTLEQALHKSKLSFAAKRQKTHNVLSYKSNLLRDETKSKYDYLRHQCYKLKDFIDSNWHNGSIGEVAMEVLAYFLITIWD